MLTSSQPTLSSENRLSTEQIYFSLIPGFSLRLLLFLGLIPLYLVAVWWARGDLEALILFLDLCLTSSDRAFLPMLIPFPTKYTAVLTSYPVPQHISLLTLPFFSFPWYNGIPVLYILLLNPASFEYSCLPMDL